MNGTAINFRFIKYHAIPKVRTRSVANKRTKKYQSTERGKETGRLKSRRYRERKSAIVDIGTLNREGGL